MQLQIDRPQYSPVPLTELLTSMDEISCKTAVIGLDEEGHPLLHEFTPHLMSHVLIQGDVGAGKSSLLKTIAVSLAMLNKQSQLQLVAISSTVSTQNVLKPLNYLPHMLEPVMESVEDCAELFNFLEEELQYRLSQNCATPTIVVLIDDMQSICNNPQMINQLHYLLQNGPNAGIYFVLAHEVEADQYLPEMVRANIPLQIVGKVHSADEAQRITGLVDSQAELLTGKGDFLTVAGESVIYFHSAFINDHELLMVVDKLHRNRPRPMLAQTFSEESETQLSGSYEDDTSEDVSFLIQDSEVVVTAVSPQPQRPPQTVYQPPKQDNQRQPVPLVPAFARKTVKPTSIQETASIEPIEVVAEEPTTPDLDIEQSVQEPERTPIVVKKPVVKFFDKEKKVHLDQNDEDEIPFDLGAPPDTV